MFLFADKEKLVLVYSRSWPLPLQLEYHNAVVVTCSKEVDLRMRCNHPKSIILSLERLY